MECDFDVDLYKKLMLNVQNTLLDLQIKLNDLQKPFLDVVWVKHDTVLVYFLIQSVESLKIYCIPQRAFENNFRMKSTYERTFKSINMKNITLSIVVTKVIDDEPIEYVPTPLYTKTVFVHTQSVMNKLITRSIDGLDLLSDTVTANTVANICREKYPLTFIDNINDDLPDIMNLKANLLFLLSSSITIGFNTTPSQSTDLAFIKDNFKKAHCFRRHIIMQKEGTCWFYAILNMFNSEHLLEMIRTRIMGHMQTLHPESALIHFKHSDQINNDVYKLMYELFFRQLNVFQNNELIDTIRLNNEDAFQTRVFPTLVMMMRKLNVKFANFDMETTEFAQIADDVQIDQDTEMIIVDCYMRDYYNDFIIDDEVPETIETKFGTFTLESCVVGVHTSGIGHVIAGGTCRNKRYMMDSNNKDVIWVDWTDPLRLQTGIDPIYKPTSNSTIKCAVYLKMKLPPSVVDVTIQDVLYITDESNNDKVFEMGFKKTSYQPCSKIKRLRGFNFIPLCMNMFDSTLTYDDFCDMYAHVIFQRVSKGKPLIVVGYSAASNIVQKLVELLLQMQCRMDLLKFVTLGQLPDGSTTTDSVIESHIYSFAFEDDKPSISIRHGNLTTIPIDTQINEEKVDTLYTGYDYVWKPRKDKYDAYLMKEILPRLASVLNTVT